MKRRPAPGIVLQMLLLLGISSAGVGIARFLYDRPLPLDYRWSSHLETAATEIGMRMVTVDEAKQITDSFSHLVLDARSNADYLTGRLPGAMSLPVNDFRDYFENVAPLLADEFPVMVYCSGLECDESLELGKILIDSGFTNVVLFAGGMTAWTNAGYRVEQ